MKFKEWYEKKHGKYPGICGEYTHTVMARVAEAIAEYVDEKIKELENNK